MRREFRFRAWDGNIMTPALYNEFIDLDGNQHTHDTRKVLMEYTGLKDKNNIDIYEFDILKDNVGRLWVLTFRRQYLSFVFEYVKDRKTFYEYNRFLTHQKPFEVIGNIYENPELLNEV